MPFKIFAFRLIILRPDERVHFIFDFPIKDGKYSKYLAVSQPQSMEFQAIEWAQPTFIAALTLQGTYFLFIHLCSFSCI